ncbi:MAG TPA: glycosyltransferase family 4 protein [Burkholderiales bacterium]|nr:glycosyltransferase family 4 protein [Burkholderiales bacterium]
MKTLLVEGWRGVHHSFALVNQHQLTHLATTKGLQVFHGDRPLFDPAWPQSKLGLEQQFRGRIRPADASAPATFDAVYRIDFPFRLHAGPARRVFVFGTSETRTFPPGYLAYDEQGSGTGRVADSVEIVAPSGWSRSGFIEAGFEPARVHVVPHGIEPIDYWHPELDEKTAVRKRLKLPDDAFVFLNIGGMTGNKGIAHLLVVFGRHKSRYSQSLLLLKGAEFLYKGQMEERVREAKSMDRAATDAALQSVVYVGKDLLPEDLSALYRAADAYVSPYHAEGFNLPVLEAIASGLPVIATAGGPTDDFCRDEFALRIESRLVTHPDGITKHLDPSLDGLLECMAQVVEREELRKSAATAGPEWAATHYSWRAVTERLARLVMT